MKLVTSILLGTTAALVLAAGSVYAEDKRDDPGFRGLDTNHTGYLSRAEASVNPELAAKFDAADKNHDGKLNHAEYLWAMTKQDATNAKDATMRTGRAVKEGIKERTTPAPIPSETPASSK